MDRQTLAFLTRLFLLLLILTARPALSQEKPSGSSRITVYKQKFNSLREGPTRPFPGATGQDGWFNALAPNPAYGEIQSSVALGRRALHEYTSSTVEGPVQKIDERLITPPNLSRYPRITLQSNFYARSSDLRAANIYTATLGVRGGPYPGFDILRLLIISGNGTPKETAGANIVLERFNGVDNNVPFYPSVGQNLAWNTWHTVTLVADQANDRYVSIKMNGKVQDLSAYSLARSQTAPGVWARGRLMESIQAAIYPNEDFGGSSEDDIYWDNMKLVVERQRKGKSN